MVAKARFRRLAAASGIMLSRQALAVLDPARRRAPQQHAAAGHLQPYARAARNLGRFT